MLPDLGFYEIFNKNTYILVNFYTNKKSLQWIRNMKIFNEVLVNDQNIKIKLRAHVKKNI